MEAGPQEEGWSIMTRTSALSSMRTKVCIIVFSIASAPIFGQSLGAFELNNYSGSKTIKTSTGLKVDIRTRQDGELVWSDVIFKGKQNKIVHRYKSLSGAAFSHPGGYLFVLPVSPQYNPRHCYILGPDGSLVLKIDVSVYEIVDFAYNHEEKLFSVLIDKFDNKIKQHVYTALGYGVGWEFKSEINVDRGAGDFWVNGKKVRMAFKLP
jgi:hypothetical protein